MNRFRRQTLLIIRKAAGTIRLEQFMRLMPSHTEYVIGLGATGALQPHIEIGDLVIPSESVKGEGMSQYYYPPDVPAKPDQELTDIMLRISSKNGAKVHTGTMFTTGSIMRETDEYIKDWHNRGYLSVDCEASAFFTLAQFCGLKSALVLYVSDNPYTVKIFTHSAEKRLKMRAAEKKAVDTIFQTLIEISEE